jgi:hypothetical protein
MAITIFMLFYPLKAFCDLAVGHALSSRVPTAKRHANIMKNHDKNYPPAM